MKPHDWETEEIDGGLLGANDFWICRTCGASGGPVWYSAGGVVPHSPKGLCFLAGTGIDLDRLDCDAAKRQVDEHKAKKVDEGKAE